MDTIPHITVFGDKRCRCCMAPSVATKDLSREYDWMGEKEVYSDMLLESFDIKLERKGTAGWMICDCCITRLRDSTNFKKQVLYSEKCLRESPNGLVDLETAKSDIKAVKANDDGDALKDECASDDDHDFETHFLEDDIDLDVDIKEEALKSEPLPSTSEVSNDEDMPLSSVAAKQKQRTKPMSLLEAHLRSGQLMLKQLQTKRVVKPAKPSSPAKAAVKMPTPLKETSKMAANAPLRHMTVPTKMKSIVGTVANKHKSNAGKVPAKLKTNSGQSTVALKRLASSLMKIKVKESKMHPTAKPAVQPGASPKGSLGEDCAMEPSKVKISKDLLTKANASLLLECSTICPFKWRGNSGYLCFYCSKPFLDPDELRKHNSEHSQENMTTFMRRVRKGQPIKVDIAAITCKLCAKDFNKINELKEHLIDEHSKTFHPDSGDGVLAFKLSLERFDCQFCSETLRTFHLLNQHMNKHFTEFICDFCGVGFLSQDRLLKHVRMHEQGTFTCKQCDKAFATAGKMDAHIHYYHTKISFKCPQCPLHFKDTIKREVHLIRVHNAEHLKHKCGSCDMEFVRKGRLSEHVRKVHLHERNYKCEYCEYACFSKQELKGHIVRHTKERAHVCRVCKKGFGRHKTLKIHMRLHFNDRRYACKVCGMAFFQSCSLKTHMKKHQHV